MAFEQGGTPFGLADAKIAEYQAPDIYGTLSDVMSVEMANGIIQLVSGIGRGDDRITVAVAVVEGSQVQLRFTGMNLSTLAILTGKTVTTIDDTNQLQFVGGEHMPYFGLIVKALSADLSDTWVFWPKCKIMENFQVFRGEYGGLSTTEVTIQCVPDDIWGLSNLITHPSSVAITVMPPADIAEVPA